MTRNNQRSRRTWLLALAALLLVPCVFIVARGYRAFVDPPSVGWTGSERWYEELLDAAQLAGMAGACIIYYVRTRHSPPPRAGLVSRVRWRDRSELRFVFYCIAVRFILVLPTSLFKAAQAAAAPAPWQTDFWSALPIDALIFPALGVALIIYDQKRRRREAREDAGQCPVCGYDLRASPDRCPECGMERHRCTVVVHPSQKD
jgi:hypothetical protein